MGANTMTGSLCESCDDKEIAYKITFSDDTRFYVCRWCLPALGGVDIKGIEQLIRVTVV